MVDNNTLEIGKTEETVKAEGLVVTPGQKPVEEKVEEEVKPEVVEVIHEDAQGNVIPPATEEDELVQG